VRAHIYIYVVFKNIRGLALGALGRSWVWCLRALCPVPWCGSGLSPLGGSLAECFVHAGFRLACAGAPLSL